MKQYTTNEQTTKLIGLGFEKPRVLYFGNKTIGDYAYTIGELIEMLPKSISHPHNTLLKFYLAISFLQSEQWYVDYETCDSALYSVAKSELVDALYEMVVKLKEEEI